MKSGGKIIAVCLLLLFLLEASLLEIKYQVFSGDGFLQANRLDNWYEIFLFIALTASSFLMIFLLTTQLLTKGLRFIFPSLTKPWFLAATGYIFVYGISLTFSYKLHHYLADHVDSSVIQAIAGNSLENAIVYISDELATLLLPTVLFTICVILLYRRLAHEVPLKTKHYRLVALSVFAAFILSVTLASHSVLKNAQRNMAFNGIYKTVSTLTDWDMDGSTLLSTPSDPDPFDSTLFWGAVDIPGNGIDENGLAGDLAVLERRAEITESFKFPAQYKNLMVIVSESTRADILTKQINGQYIAPNLRQLAATGSSIKHAYSHSGFTSTSLYTLFSGAFQSKGTHKSIFVQAHENNYEVSVISGQDETWGNLDKKLGTRRVADFFYDPQTVPDKRVYASKLASSIKLSDATITQALRKRLDHIDLSKRQLFYLNFQSGHFPYYHKFMDLKFIEKGIPRREINQENKAWLSKTYWNAMAYMDDHLGQVINALKEKGIYDETLIVFLGDHGEELFDSGFLGHGHNINTAQLHIPLVLSAPGVNFEKPIGLSGIHGWLSSFIDPASNTAVKYGQCVLLYTGKFRKPAQIGQVCSADNQLQVYTIAFDQYTGAPSSEPISKLKASLAHTWESALFKDTPK
ncbi:sulfatase-like hydrolase/transferase [Kordiimonas pumila]|uniref:Sulfatase-like hydrolase/transferase n=1 Tax=Kordiimonas pumila TaxID=2161677 RepID=A0ABV7D0E0_9PROT|nr:sulfatase-like hydrolase/transferase [Kordiimonas pumila]